MILVDERKFLVIQKCEIDGRCFWMTSETPFYGMGGVLRGHEFYPYAGFREDTILPHDGHVNFMEEDWRTIMDAALKCERLRTIHFIAREGEAIFTVRMDFEEYDNLWTMERLVCSGIGQVKLHEFTSETGEWQHISMSHDNDFFLYSSEGIFPIAVSALEDMISQKERFWAFMNFLMGRDDPT